MLKFISQILIASLIAFLSPQSAAANPVPPKISITTINTPNLKVVGSNGERGAAITKLGDSKFLLGGGRNGSNLYLYDLTTRSEQLIGRVISPNQRINDSRFAITDIAVLASDSKSASILISYPIYNKTSKCVVVKLSAYEVRLTEKPKLSKVKDWFTSKPCVPVSAVQHAAGRLEVIDKASAYLTIGDLGFKKIGSKSARGDLGSVFKVKANKVEKISSGHRNQQGIVLIGTNLYISEHGPRGGDELNLIKKGADYGWPTVTYGDKYGFFDYVKPSRPGTHKGFEKPLYYWVPSVAPTELIQLPTSSTWGSWSEQLVMGTLANQTLIFIQLLAKQRVGAVVSVDVGQRIRDLEVTSIGSILATTDSGQLLLINPAE
ncbi:MAG: PQQ-dependent sugar dehydrogenase [Actinomycetota bacterium]|jgi:aldose sugar dehydrogenase|nr:MAG: glucose dehydrogenase [Actinobacteria bacterium BACL4 MAG-120507-bin0]MDA2965137.1 PQQ-dependent sugar dehydrogenase [Actinomycetota bacterium]MDA2997408.1 PQQ-dependent sugar dehydrogenase [Actinomycetota bacterium]MDA3036158.1 PQQ-dependent sugar dehydrogenase [Actinomycetota bacterium]